MTEDDIETWHRFKSGETAKAIADNDDIGIGTVLKIVLSVEELMGSSPLFYEQRQDGEGCPSPIPKDNVEIPVGNKNLEKWLQNK